MPKPNITYLLGAGASFNRLPTIDTMADRFKKFREHLEAQQWSVGQNPTISKIKGLLKLVEEESRRFNTVDTYARSLFLNERYKHLTDLKAILSICFMYWQLYDGRGNVHTPSPNIDHRYISLISAFLQKRKDRFLEIPENIKFLTWNYDIQIELALKYFTDFVTHPPYMSDLQAHYKSIPGPRNIIAPSIVHLNGIAGIYPDRIDVQGSVGNAADLIKENHSDFGMFIDIMAAYFQDFYSPINSKHLEYFSYSWEKNSVTDYSMNAAEDILKNTDILVIIGYSFPVFNRETDRRLLGGSRKFKVYYQDPHANKIALSNIFDIPLDKIYEEKNCNQFLLPHEF